MKSDPLNLHKLLSLADVLHPTHSQSEAAAYINQKLLEELQAHQIELEKRNEELRHAQIELEKIRDRYLDLYDFAPIGYVILGNNGIIENINLTGAKLFAKDRTQLLNQLFTLQVNSADRDRWQLFFWNLMRFNGHKTTELSLKRGDNSFFYGQLEGVRLTNQNQDIQIRLALTDISDHKRAEITLKEANRQTEKANRLKSEFLANISHEIRTPMNAIIGMTHLVQRTKLNEKQANYLSKISIASHTLLGIINNILDFSKIEAGKLELEEERFKLEEVFSYLADLNCFIAKEKNIELVFSMAEKTPKHLVGDSLRLSQILYNLLNNAIKFSDSGKITLTVMPLELSATRVNLQFSVQDSGIGMTQEQILHLFQPFSQIDNSISRKYGGTGLGLAISKQLVKMMLGRIWVKSQVDTGSTFYFTAKFGIAEQNDAVELISKTLDYAVNLTGKKVLLVEDDAINAELVVELLMDLGIETEIAKNGKQAVQHVKNQRFDLVLMDIQMPEMDGLTATRLIRSDKRFQDLPIIAVTAHAMSCDREKSLSVGMNDYMAKPINPKKLADTLGYWLKGSLSLEKTIQTQVCTDKLLPAQLLPFNISSALERVKGNQALLHRLILMFYDENINTCVNLDQLVSEGNYEQAQLLIHKLKGAAMILEIEELPNIATIVERAIEKRDVNKINLYLKTLKSVLTPAIEAAALLNQSD